MLECLRISCTSLWTPTRQTATEHAGSVKQNKDLAAHAGGTGILTGDVLHIHASEDLG